MNSAWALQASGGGRVNAIRLWVVFVVGLAIGGTLSAMAIGLLAGLLPWLPSAGAVVVAAVLAVALAIYDLAVARVNLPQRRELIPQNVFFRSHMVGFLRFGLEFGSGVRTLVTSASPYILIATMLALPMSFAQVAVTGLAFGIGRSVGPLQAVLGDEMLWSQDLGRISRLLERAGSVLAATVVVMAAISMLR